MKKKYLFLLLVVVITGCSFNLLKDDKLNDSELDEFGKKLYNKIAIYDEVGNTFFFRKNSENSKMFTNAEKLTLALQLVPEDKKEKANCNNDWCASEIIKKDDFKDAVIALWGSNSGVKYNSFTNDKYITSSCEINGKDDFECMLPEGIGGDCLDKIILNYNKTKYDGNDIVVELKYLLLTCEWKMENDIDVNYYNVYADPEKTMLIGEEEKANLVYEKYGDSAGIFEVTFKKDTKTNDYYFYKSELKK